MIHVAMCTYIHIHLKSIGGVSLRLGGRKMEGSEEAVSEAHVQGLQLITFTCHHFLRFTCHEPVFYIVFIYFCIKKFYLNLHVII